MAEPFALTVQKAQLAATVQALRKCNDVSQRYGLSLDERQIQSLAQARSEALQYAARIEMGESVLPRLIYAFCDSPYINRDDYAATLATLQDLFYTFKNETEDGLSDDELIEALRTVFNGKAQGSLDYLENLTTSDLWHALTSPDQIADDDGDTDEYDFDE